MADKDKAFKVVGLIASVLAGLGLMMGASMWLAKGMADLTVATQTNATKLEAMARDHIRMEAAIDLNSRVLSQHEKLLAILEQHGEELKVLHEFMLRGDRYTLEMGTKHEARTTAIEHWIKEAPPDWFEAQFLIVVNKIDKLADKVADNHEAIVLLKHEVKIHQKGEEPR